jgi:hypothetical protein
MCLRKSPLRTAALLAANRANAARSTGPRTLRGKRASAWNALRHGRFSQAAWAAEPRDARDAEAFEAFRQTLRVAVVAANSELGERTVRERALQFWKAKRLLDHWLERRAGPASGPDDRMPPLVTTIYGRPGSSICPGWKVKVSIRLRWGRSPAVMRLVGLDLESARAAFRAWRTRRRRGHTVVIVTCTGHPWTTRYRQRLRANPECHRKGVAWTNIIDDFESDGTASGVVPHDLGIPSVAPGASRREPGLGSPDSVSGVCDSGQHQDSGFLAANKSLMGETKPECHRKDVACENVIEL